MEPSSSLTRGPLGVWGSLCIRPLTCRAREIDGLVVRVNKVTIDLSRHSTKRMNRAGAMDPSTSSLTRGPWVSGAALHLTPGPLTCGARRAREIDGLVVRVKVTIDLRSRHSTKRMHRCRGYETLLVA
jgi:hypothetical protein